jgi:hypothetical protein
MTKSIKHGSYKSRREPGIGNDYQRALDEADPNYKENKEIDTIFAVDEQHEDESEEQSFIDKVFNVYEAYRDGD